MPVIHSVIRVPSPTHSPYIFTHYIYEQAHSLILVEDKKRMKKVQTIILILTPLPQTPSPSHSTHPHLTTHPQTQPHDQIFIE